MKLAILSESPADERAIQILATAVLHRPFELVEPRPRSGGWAAAVAALETEVRRVHYTTDATGLIIVVDSDDSTIYDLSHVSDPVSGCRICQINAIFRRTFASLKPLQNRAEIKIAIGFPVPAIEAWYQCGKAPHAAEAPFVRSRQSGRRLAATRRQLKFDVYGTERPSLEMEASIAVQEATRLAGDLQRLRDNFPLGFGSFYETLASWR